MKRLFIALAAWASLCPVAGATITIDVGTHFLHDNTPNQVIEIYAHSPGDLVQGLDFMMQIVQVNGVAPKITAVSLIDPDMMFGASNTGQGNFGAPLPSQLVAFFTTSNINVQNFIPA